MFLYRNIGKNNESFCKVFLKFDLKGWGLCVCDDVRLIVSLHMYVYIIHAFTYECVLKIKCTSIVSWLFALNETSQQLHCCCCGLCSLWGIEITVILIMKEGSIKTYPLVLATRPCIDDPREIHTPCWCGSILQEIILIRSQNIYIAL